MLYALTLWRPWAHAVARLGKDVENRDTRPPDFLVGKYLGIHAGKTFDEEAAAKLRAEGFEVPPQAEHASGAIVAVARVVRCVEASESRWFFGPYGWQLAEVRAIAPVECRGMPGVFTPSRAVAEAVRAAWKAAGHSEGAAPEDGTTPGGRLLATHAAEFEESVRIIMTEEDCDRMAAEWRALAQLLVEVEKMERAKAEREAVRTLAARDMRRFKQQAAAARASRTAGGGR